MENNLYRIEKLADFNLPQIDCTVMLVNSEGMAFVKLHPVRLKAQPSRLECDRDCGSCWKPKLTTHEWIPVSERLPAATDLVVFLTQFEGVHIGKRITDMGTFRVHGTSCDMDAIAWLPLPDPTKVGL